MKALMLKDLYVLWKQAKLFFVLVLVFAAVPSSFNSTFAVIYAAMLPYTAMAYDERSKWDQLAAMMPYTERDIVLSKYVFGWLATLASAALSMLLQAAVGAVTNRAGSSATVLVMAFCASMCILAFSLPMMFRFGVERGRLAMFVIIFLICGTAGAFGTITTQGSDGSVRLPAFLMIALPMAAAALTAVSIPLSMGLYRRRSV